MFIKEKKLSDDDINKRLRISTIRFANLKALFNRGICNCFCHVDGDLGIKCGRECCERKNEKYLDNYCKMK